MALKYFGGRTPSVDAPWTCPSCGAENQVPLKAGCQVCRAGADAKRVGAPEPPPADPAPPARPVLATDHPSPFWQWQDAHKDQLGLQSPGVWALMEEAFMAGVAWAQAQAAERRAEAETAIGQLVSEGVREATPVFAGCDFDPITQHTILAALAFYRDNQLQYGAVPGQLSAEQVTDLIQRLSPPEGL